MKMNDELYAVLEEVSEAATGSAYLFLHTNPNSDTIKLANTDDEDCIEWEIPKNLLDDDIIKKFDSTIREIDAVFVEVFVAFEEGTFSMEDFDGTELLSLEWEE